MIPSDLAIPERLPTAPRQRLLALDPRQRTAPLLEPDDVFVGRAAEITVLRDRAARAANGLTQLVVIEGQAGIGKTTLVDQALAPLDGWRQLHVRLDEQDRTTRGAAAWRVFHGGEEPPSSVPGTVADQVAQYIAVCDANTQPTIVVIEDVHWIDDTSAEVLWHVLRAIDTYPGLLIATMRPSELPQFARLRRLAQSSPQGAHLPLAPLDAAESQQYLQEHLGVRVSGRVAERAHVATGGYPLHLGVLTRWLKRAPRGQRTIDDALTALRDPTDPRLVVFERAIGDIVAAAGEPVRSAQNVLGVADRRVKREVLTELVGTPVDHDELMATGLVRWHARERAYAIEHPNVAQAIRAPLSRAELAHIFRRLARHGSEIERLRARVGAMDAAPVPAERELLVGDLVKAGVRAMVEDRPARGLDFLLAAVRYAPRRDVVALAAQCAFRANAPARLSEIEPQVRSLPRSALRSALVARLSLVRGAGDEAVRAMQGAPLRDLDADTLLIYAQVACDLARQFIEAGHRGRIGQVLPATLVALAELERALPVAPDPVASLPDVTRTRAAVASRRAVITMWHRFDTVAPQQAVRMIDDLRTLVSELEEVPGTEPARREIRAVIAARLRLMGARGEAYRELQEITTRLTPEAGVNVGAQVQLALILFEAALWDEAYSAIEVALAHAMENGEDAGMAMVYAVAALILGSRGETAAAEEHLQRVDDLRAAQASGNAAALAHYARAWAALSAGDAERLVLEMTRVSESTVGWWLVGVPAGGLLARGLSQIGRPELLPELADRLQNAAIPAIPGVRAAAIAHVRALHARAMGDARAAGALFREALEHLDAEPVLRESLDRVHGLRLTRAVLALDIAEFACDIDADLGEERESVIRIATWASNIFHRCGAATLQAAASGFADRLRQGRTPAARSLPLVPLRAVGSAVGPALEGLSRLTARERQIAMLVGAGLANREVAAELVLSVRTVEYHVANVLDKLDLSSRVELRRLLRTSGAHA
ncbi:helix-turn-helix transcriptional regulator [Microbacterium sediminis]|uniref:Uncharacterized protein n=1 Tax=Microbacterium sediminis TaxID=904291 RepID=A0A1B9NGP7_9MICO|nr:LuxR family transcriptional regulator [Microbacterium sediminis]OCG75789.1 hypothetical protein A7J15_01725 [Microbacterium sediminis]QBR74183.1 LuxR family transcriptional regulator [Microbacterium sediminis]